MKIVSANIKFVLNDGDEDIASIKQEELGDSIACILAHEHIGLAVYNQIKVNNVVVTEVEGESGEDDPPPGSLD